MLINSRSLIQAAWSLVLLSLMVACQGRIEVAEEPQGSSPESQEGEEFTFSGYLLPSDNLESSLKSTHEESELNNIQSLRILVFDDSYRFQYSADAVLTYEPINVGSYNDDQFLPDNHRGEVTRAFSYKVTLKTSREPRILHFVTDADWSSVANDLKLQGVSAGAILPRLTTNTFDPMWCEVKVNNLYQQTLSNKVVKLVRNYAVVKVDFQAQGSGFTPTGYFITNLPNKSSVVPYTINPNTLEISFPTPFSSMQVPTVPADLELVPGPMQFKNMDQRTELFEVDNDNFYRDKTFMILRGRYDGDTADRYFKLDFVSQLSATNTTANYIPIMRNHEYTFVIKEATSKGYPTVEEAIKGIANNNILMSVNTRYISAFKYGEYELTIAPIAALLTRVDQHNRFDLHVSDNAEIVDVVSSWNGADEYLEPISTDRKSYFDVKQKRVPISHMRTYYVDVVARTRSGEYFSRRAYIYLNEPLKMEPKLERVGAKAAGNSGLYRAYYKLTIELEEGHLPGGVLPIHISINTDNLTYFRSSDPLDNPTEEAYLPLFIQIDRETGTHAYSGTVSEKNVKYKRLIVYFTSNTLGDYYQNPPVEVRMKSTIHEERILTLPTRP